MSNQQPPHVRRCACSWSAATLLLVSCATMYQCTALCPCGMRATASLVKPANADMQTQAPQADTRLKKDSTVSRSLCRDDVQRPLQMWHCHIVDHKIWSYTSKQYVVCYTDLSARPKIGYIQTRSYVQATPLQTLPPKQPHHKHTPVEQLR
jgi:hypothetical protein